MCFLGLFDLISSGRPVSIFYFSRLVVCLIIADLSTLILELLVTSFMAACKNLDIDCETWFAISSVFLSVSSYYFIC